MMETTLSIEEAARTLDEVVERVRANGTPAVLTKSGQPLARIVPLPPPAAGDLIAFLRRWRVDYPLPDEQFGEAVRESRQAVRPPQDPWE